MSNQNENPTATDGGLSIPDVSGHSTAPEMGEKTFTQSDLDRIIGERLARVKADYGAKEKQLENERFQLQAREIIKQKGLSDELLTVLKVSDVTELDAALAILDKQFDFSNPYQAYMCDEGGKWTKVSKNNRLDWAPPGNITMTPDEMSGIRRAMGLSRKE